MSFLKAEWKKLILVNYEFDEKLLLPYLPAKTELDKWNDTTYVSLVGFMFQNTSVLGVKIPFHVNFAEVNLRFYVKHKHAGEWKRGVVFIKEIVPRHAITFVANNFYREHYATRPMRHTWNSQDEHQIIEYAWKERRKWQSFCVKSETSKSIIEQGSEAAFITEHYWGYTKVNKNKTFEYEVTHPVWDQYKIKSYEVKVDFSGVYGTVFKDLNSQIPKSVMLAEGSPITVENKRKI